MIIDTSVMVGAVERKDPTAIAAISALPGPSIRSFVVDGELAAGAEVASMLRLPAADVEMREATADAYRRLSEQPEALPLDVVASHFAWLTGLSALRKLRLGQNDRWILAEALTLHTRVLTADTAMHQLGVVAGETLGSPPLTEPLNQ